MGLFSSVLLTVLTHTFVNIPAYTHHTHKHMHIERNNVLLCHWYAEETLHYVYCVCVCFSACVCMCFGENPASWLTQLDLETLLKHNKHPPVLFSNSKSLTLPTSIFLSTVFYRNTKSSQKVHCYCSWLKGGGNPIWISVEGVATMEKPRLP